MKATHTGSKFNQHKEISWSYLNLGNTALTHTNIKQNKHVLRPKIIPSKEITEVFTNNSGIE